MNPYESLPQSAFWKPAVADRAMLEIDCLWNPKFEISKHAAISTYGSCFAQHIGRALKVRGYTWNITETAPQGMSDASASTFNYGIFSSRTANIYTTTLLQQWLSWATGRLAPPDEVWQHDNRFIDPFRPHIEPNGFCDVEELLASRNRTIDCLRASIMSSEFFVFTLGLTESWHNVAAGYEYPMCPGTVGGTFDPERHEFRNLEYGQIVDSLRVSLEMMKELNPKLRFILTVSPVPLTATKSGQHVLVATMHSKSILRAVAGHFHAHREDVDYFPSYEIINSPVFRGAFFEGNLRSVSRTGVAFVMDSFFKCLGQAATPSQPSVPQRSPSPTALPAALGNDEHCEEAFLEAFASASK
jgi:hypothetical protein